MNNFGKFSPDAYREMRDLALEYISKIKDSQKWPADKSVHLGAGAAYEMKLWVQPDDQAGDIAMATVYQKISHDQYNRSDDYLTINVSELLMEQHIVKLNEYLEKKSSADKKIAQIEKTLKKLKIDLPYLGAKGILDSVVLSDAPDTSEVIKYLVDGGIDINMFCEMYELIEDQEHALIEALLANGYNPNAYDCGNGYSQTGVPLWFRAVLLNDKASVKLFFKHKADLNLKSNNSDEVGDNHGILAYFYSITSDETEDDFAGTKHDETVMVRFLIENGVDLKDPHGGGCRGRTFREMVEKDFDDHPRQELWLNVIDELEKSKTGTKKT